VTDSTLKSSVKERYGQAALRVSDGITGGACCGSSACCGATTEAWDPITSDLYDERQKAGIPAEALLASLGCGNPTALATLNEGETVLDLGSGGGPGRWPASHIPAAPVSRHSTVVSSARRMGAS